MSGSNDDEESADATREDADGMVTAVRGCGMCIARCRHQDWNVCTSIDGPTHYPFPLTNFPHCYVNFNTAADSKRNGIHQARDDVSADGSVRGVYTCLFPLYLCLFLYNFR